MIFNINKIPFELTNRNRREIMRATDDDDVHGFEWIDRIIHKFSLLLFSSSSYTGVRVGRKMQ